MIKSKQIERYDSRHVRGPMSGTILYRINADAIDHDPIIGMNFP